MSGSMEFDTSRLASADLDVKAWINEAISRRTAGATTTEQRVTQLLTNMQLHQQTTANSLEELINQAVVRLPRVALDVERMATDAIELSEKLAVSAAQAAEVVQSVPPEAEALAELRRTKEKLTYCAKILQKAKMLSVQVEDLEHAARSGKVGGATKDVSDMESIATSVAEVHASLRDVQRVDPSFGSAMEPRLRALEAELQHNVEKECLDLLKRQDKSSAPKLLAALRKIQRDDHVMHQYLLHIVGARKNQLVADVKSSGMHGAPIGLPGAQQHRNGEAVSLTLAQYYRSAVKALIKDVEYLDLLYPTEPVAADKCAADLITKLSAATSELVLERLQSLGTNDEIVNCYRAVSAEIRKGYTGGLERYNALIDLLTRSSEQPFESLVPQFVSREQHAIEGALDAVALLTEMDNKSAAKVGMEKITSSLDRCLHFFPSATLPRALLSATDTLTRVLNTLSAPSAQSSSSAQSAFRQYSVFCVVAKTVGLLVDPSNGWFVNVQRSPTAHVIDDGLLIKAAETIVGAEMSARRAAANSVCGTMMTPFQRVLKEYISSPMWTVSGSAGTSKGLVAFNAGQVAPSDLIRQFGASLMELPVMLEAVEAEATDFGDDEDGQVWLGRIVTEVVQHLATQVNTIQIRHRAPSAASPRTSDVSLLPALEQLACDIEYIGNVLAAVSEASFDVLGTISSKLQELCEAEKRSPGTVKEGPLNELLE